MALTICRREFMRVASGICASLTGGGLLSAQEGHAALPKETFDKMERDVLVMAEKYSLIDVESQPESLKSPDRFVSNTYKFAYSSGGLRGQEPSQQMPSAAIIDIFSSSINPGLPPEGPHIQLTYKIDEKQGERKPSLATVDFVYLQLLKGADVQKVRTLRGSELLQRFLAEKYSEDHFVVAISESKPDNFDAKKPVVTTAIVCTDKGGEKIREYWLSELPYPHSGQSSHFFQGSAPATDSMEKYKSIFQNFDKNYGIHRHWGEIKDQFEEFCRSMQSKP